ncbi:hypothetical protein [Bartonella sp. TS25HLJMH]|uniref:hypothetical protein n=1 Tax=Bartonella sp. TS25HLJMH TaxID=3243576 RepID=UPI0035CEC0B1
MLDTLNIIAMIVCLLSLPMMIVGLVLVCIKKWRKNGLKTLGIGALLFIGSAIVGASVHKDKPNQITHNNEIVTSSSTSSIDVATQNESVTQVPAEDTDKQITPTQVNKPDKDDGLGFWGWGLLIILTFSAGSALYNYCLYRRKKHFEQQVAMLQPDIPPFNFSEACEMFQELDASEYDYRLAPNEKLLGVQEYANFVGKRRVNKIEQMVVLARGRLLVTDQAIVFESSEKNERTTWTRIASVDITYEGCRVNRRSGIPWNYKFTATPQFAAVVRALGQPY